MKRSGHNFLYCSEFQLWVCTIRLLQESRNSWAQTMALYWDLFELQKGELHQYYLI